MSLEFTYFYKKRNIALFVTIASIILISSFSTVYAESAIELKLKSPYYDFGKNIDVQGSVNFQDGVVAGTNLPKGLRVSIEVYDSSKNIVYANSVPVKNDQFAFTIHTGEGTKITSAGKFTIIAYYGSPQPTLLNTPASTSASFLIKNAPSIVDEPSPAVTDVESDQGVSSRESAEKSPLQALKEQSTKVIGDVSKAIPGITDKDSSWLSNYWWLFLLFLFFVLPALAGARRRRARYVQTADYQNYAKQYGYDQYENAYKSAMGSIFGGLYGGVPKKEEHRKPDDEPDKLPN